MFTKDELVFTANLINAAIPEAVKTATDVANVNHLLNKIGQVIQELDNPPAANDEDENESDLPTDG
jgi:hypothetical protein